MHAYPSDLFSTLNTSAALRELKNEGNWRNTPTVPGPYFDSPVNPLLPSSFLSSLSVE